MKCSSEAELLEQSSRRESVAPCGGKPRVPVYLAHYSLYLTDIWAYIDAVCWSYLFWTKSYPYLDLIFFIAIAEFVPVAFILKAPIQ